MKIIRSERKRGIYAQWFDIVGFNERGESCTFLIYHHQADTYKKAIKHWNNFYGKTCKALFIKNSEPYNNSHALAC